MPRANFSRKVKAQAFVRCNGHCEKCSAKLKAGEAEYDHIRDAANRGSGKLENCQVLCRVCHAEKTKQSIRDMRRMERARDRQNNALVRRSQPIQSAGFPQSSKRPALWVLAQQEMNNDN